MSTVIEVSKSEIAAKYSREFAELSSRFVREDRGSHITVEKIEDRGEYFSVQIVSSDGRATGSLPGACATIGAGRQLYSVLKVNDQLKKALCEDGTGHQCIARDLDQVLAAGQIVSASIRQGTQDELQDVCVER